MREQNWKIQSQIYQVFIRSLLLTLSGFKSFSKTFSNLWFYYLLQNIVKVSYIVNYLKITFLKNTPSETSQLIGTAGQLTGLIIIRIFSRRDLETDYYIAIHWYINCIININRKVSGKVKNVLKMLVL